MKTISLLLLLLAATCHADEPARPDLTGQVVNAEGAAVPGARVMVLAAGPRTGSSPLCPYNYPDCDKRTLSDAQGDFRLPSLDPAMDFCVAVLAPGFEPFVQSKILPETGPLTARLRARDLSKLPPGRLVAGRLLGPDGAPVAGAVVDVEGVEQGSGTHYGGNDATDSMAVSDDQGEFHLAGRKDFAAVLTQVNASGFAPRWARLEPGKTALLRLKTGATVQGRVLRGGQPVGGVTLGLASEDRAFGKFFHGLQATTVGDGRFVFRHVPAEVKFQLFSTMSSCQDKGISCRRDFVSAAEAGVTDCGDLPASPAYRLQGRVVLADGKPVPPNTRLMIDRGAAWDTALLPLDADGKFDVSGVPAESIGLFVQVGGYHLSTRNPNLNPNSHGNLVGRVTADMAALNILLEPGHGAGWNDIDRPDYEDQQKAEQMPLRGVP